MLAKNIFLNNPKDKKSKELSDMADQRGKLQFQIRIDVDGELTRDQLGNNFFLEIENAKVTSKIKFRNNLSILSLINFKFKSVLVSTF